MFRMRAPLSLVAVFAAVVLVAAGFVGGRLVQDWKAVKQRPSAAASPQSQLAELEARPLRIPTYHTYTECTSGPFNKDGSLGSGPVYSYGANYTPVTDWGTYFYNVAYTDARISGPILVRGRDLFTKRTIVFVGPGATGPVVGSDVVDGRSLAQHTELVLYAAQAVPSIDPHWNRPNDPHAFVWEIIAGAPGSWSGSTGWQIDGAGFSELFYAC